MKIQNVGLDNAYAIVRGWVSDLAAAASGLISVTDETTGVTVGPVNSMTLVGQLINDGGLGNIVVDVQAVLTEYLNNSGVDLVYGDVVVIDSSADIAVTTTTTAQDTRQIGVVLANIGAGGSGPVQTGGVVQFVNTTASVTRGEYAETSTTAKKATQNATKRTGSFGIFLESGTTPTMLFLGANSSTAPGVYETVIEGGGSVVKAHGNMGSTETFDPTDGNVHTGTLNANCTFTLNPPTDVTVTCTLELRITEDGTGAYTITWPGSVTWLGGTPSPSTAAGALSVYLIETIDGGTTWLGVLVGAGLGSSSFATPNLTLGTANAAGSATTTIRSDATLLAFDATVPAALGTAAAGAATVAARRDHVHPKATETEITLANVTTDDVTSTKHGFAPISPADATKFLNGAATPAYAQVKDSDLSTTDITTNNSSSSKHGFLPKLSGSAGQYLDGTGAWVTVTSSDHEHLVNLQYNGDGATTAFELPAAPFDQYSVDAYVAGVRQDITLSGTFFTTMTFGAAPGSGTNNIQVDIVAALA